MFTQAYRLFFPLAALFTALSVIAWLSGLSGKLALPAEPTLWHAHEMVFGFAAAIIVGFVLTAAGNWTGRQAAQPCELAVLCGVWLLARVTAFMPSSNMQLSSTLIDCLFLPSAAFLITRVLLQTGNRRNYMFVPFLWGLALVNLGYHVCLYNGRADDARLLITLTAYLIGFLMVFMGGRVIPFFSANRCHYKPTQWPWLNWLSTLSSLVAGITIVAMPMSILSTYMASIAGISTLLRLLLWRPWLVWRVPLLWILHIGYGWLAAAYFLAAMTNGSWLAASSLPIHGLMAGGLGSLGMGMIIRVALGHSGRSLEINKTMIVVLVLVTLAGLLRVTSYIPWAYGGIPSLTASGILWSSAFFLYFLIFAPLLWCVKTNSSA